MPEGAGDKGRPSTIVEECKPLQEDGTSPARRASTTEQKKALALAAAAQQQHPQEQIAKLIPEFSAARFLNDLLRTATLGTYPHDQEENEDSSINAFVPEPEPSPAPTDAWARSAVPIKSKRKEESLEDEVTGLSSTREKIPSSDGGGTRNRRGSTFSRTASIKNMRRRSSALSTGPQIFDIPRQRPSEEDQSPPDMSILTGNASAPNTAARIEEKHRKVALIAEERDKTERIERQIREARGKPYTIDDKGNFILISQAEPTPLLLHVQAVTKDVPNPTRRRSSVVKREGGGGPDSITASIDLSNSNVDSSSDSTFFVEAASKNRSLLETTILSPGVTLRCNGVVKEGPRRAEDAKHISRKEYLNRLTIEQETSASFYGTRSLIFQQTSKLDATQMGDGSTIRSTSPALCYGTRSPGRYMHNENEENDNNTEPILQDIDVYAGGRPFSPPELPEVIIRDPDLEITHAADWGQPKRGDPHNGPLPHKPNTRQRKMIQKMFGGGQHEKGPRDRLLPKVTHPTAENRKLAVPPIGCVMGHGLMVSGDEIPPSFATGTLSNLIHTQRSEEDSSSLLHLPQLTSPNSRTSFKSTSHSLGDTIHGEIHFHVNQANRLLLV